MECYSTDSIPTGFYESIGSKSDTRGWSADLTTFYEWPASLEGCKKANQVGLVLLSTWTGEDGITTQVSWLIRSAFAASLGKTTFPQSKRQIGEDWSAGWAWFWAHRCETLEVAARLTHILHAAYRLLCIPSTSAEAGPCRLTRLVKP